jgi:hypothetical protein
MAKEAVISTSSINSYGTRVLTSGIDINQYLKNPVLLYMHNRPWQGTTNEVGVIGRMENIRIEGDKLIGTPVFNEKNEFAKARQQEWEDGFIKMLSAGLDIIEQSEAPEHILPGQKRMTLTKTKLVEVSIVDIGANDDSLVLYHNGKQINLSAGSQDLDFLNMKVENNKTNNNKNKETMEKIALSLGLEAAASESDVLAKITQLKNENKEAVELRKQHEEQMNSAIEQEVRAAIACSKITADKKEHFVKLGKTMGLMALQQTLGLIAVPAKPTGSINQTTANPGGADAKYKKMSEVPREELVKLRKDDPKEYARLYKVEFGVEPEMKD